jgi:hypothetical protein
MFYTYAHHTPDGRLFYIGKGSGKRAQSHRDRNTYWYNIVAKYGNPKVSIIANWGTPEEAYAHEIELIKQNKAAGEKLCNLSDGGEGSTGFIMPAEAKIKISLSLLGNKRALGYEQSIEQRAENRSYQLGNSRAVGHQHTEQHKQKMSSIFIGNKNAIGNNYKWVGTCEEDNHMIEFTNTTQINKAGFQHANIIKCLNGERKSHKGYTWSREAWSNA